MRCLVWNCRGLGSPEAIDSLHDLVKQEAPSLMTRVKRRLNFNNGVCVDPCGRAGGLSLMWSNDIEFPSVVDDLGLKDIPIEGRFYTWSNRRDGDDFLEEKLDRVLANNEWLNVFPDSCANTITWDGSEHFPIVFKLNQEVEGPTEETPKLFRFEARWLHDENFDTFLKEAWNDSLSEGNGQWEECVYLCGQRLKTWDANVYKKSPKD
ncbi:DELLA protein GAIP-B [Bienertia sinuspersici]